MTSVGQSPEQDGKDAGGARALIVALRYVLPGLVVLGGLVVMAFGSEADLEGGAGIVSAGLAVYAMSWLYRASVDGDHVRAQEEAARDFYGAHGRWPDEVPAEERSTSRSPASGASEPASGARAAGQRTPSTLQAPRRAHGSARPRRPGGSR